MSVLSTLRRKGYTATLMAFRRLPPPLRRTLVRAGTPGYTVGAVCAIEHDGHLLFLRQPHRDGWSLPGGLLDRGETPALGVVREIREETGLEVEVGDPVATEVHPRVRRVDVVFHILVDERPPVRVGGEAKDHHWWRPGDVPAVDASTREILAVLARPRGDEHTAGRVVHHGG